MKNEKLENILCNQNFSKEEVIYLLSLAEKHDIERLFRKADQIRKDFCGEEVHLRGVIEISNHCEQNCLFCGLRDDNFTVKRYRMEPDEIIETAAKLVKLGIYTIVLKSGEDRKLDTDIIAHIIYSIKKSTNVAITLSLGERGLDEYKTWKIAGADRYILRHESCDSKKYAYYRNKETHTNRIQQLKYLKRLGYQIGDGTIIGLPLQTIDEIADDILLFQEMDSDMIAFSPFIPSPFTPFQNKPAGSVELTLKAIAVARLLLKNVHIPATTALDSLDPQGKEKGLKCGANILMPNYTPYPYRESYSIYPNRRDSNSDPFDSHKLLVDRISNIGRDISFSRGDSLRNSSFLHL